MAGGGTSILAHSTSRVSRNSAHNTQHSVPEDAIFRTCRYHHHGFNGCQCCRRDGSYCSFGCVFINVSPVSDQCFELRNGRCGSTSDLFYNIKLNPAVAIFQVRSPCLSLDVQVG